MAGSVRKPLLEGCPQFGNGGYGLVDDDRTFRGAGDAVGEPDPDGKAGGHFGQFPVPVEETGRRPRFRPVMA